MAVDRRINDSDVMERVLGVDYHEGDEVRTEVVNLGIAPGISGVAVSAVQVTSGSGTPRRQKTRNRR